MWELLEENKSGRFSLGALYSSSIVPSFPLPGVTSHAKTFSSSLVTFSLHSSSLSLHSLTPVLSLSLYPCVSQRGRQTSAALGKCFAVGRSLGFKWL